MHLSERLHTDKDVFRTYYFRGLSKRLLLARSASDDQEKMVIELLKRGRFGYLGLFPLMT
jgi:hypothetical protein